MTAIGADGGQLRLDVARYHEAAAQAMTEEQLYEAIRAMCAALRLMLYHALNSRGSTSGYPDLHILGRGGQLFRELKSQRGKLRAEQLVWLDALHEAGADASVWRPEDLLNGRIRDELLAVSRRERTS